MAIRYDINLNYVCNERCVFCATDLTNNYRMLGRKPWVTLDELRAWVGDTPPGPEDQVLIAGGEPTLHKDLVPILEFLSAGCPNVTIFSNGVRLADPDFVRSVALAGVTRFEIPLFGATAEAHEAVTRLRGSFARTLAALDALVEVRHERPYTIGVRLLVSKQSSAENPAIVRLIAERYPTIDFLSITRLQLSQNADRSDSAISWAEARADVNESFRLARETGFHLLYETIPLCVFDGENAAFIQHDLLRQAGTHAPRYVSRYFDATVPSGIHVLPPRKHPPVLPEPCIRCDYFRLCRRVEPWEVERFGVTGLRSVRLTQLQATATGG